MTARMSAHDRAAIVAMLRYRERATGAVRSSAQASLASLGQARDAAQADDEHDPEGATLSAEWSRLTAVLRSADDELGRIALALVRSSDDEFGRCAGCGEPIPIERLAVRPEAAMCVPCASATR